MSETNKEVATAADWREVRRVYNEVLSEEDQLELIDEPPFVMYTYYCVGSWCKDSDFDVPTAYVTADKYDMPHNNGWGLFPNGWHCEGCLEGVMHFLNE